MGISKLSLDEARKLHESKSIDFTKCRHEISNLIKSFNLLESNAEVAKKIQEGANAEEAINTYTKKFNEKITKFKELNAEAESLELLLEDIKKRIDSFDQ